MTTSTPPPGSGRFAPSPSGDLHLGSLRTALLAWLFARSTDRRFLLRVEDLDRVRPGAAAQQLADLEAIGIDWDGAVVRQSERAALYADAVRRLREAGRTYECFCSRREIREAPSAPHAPPGAYPGTCRDLSAAELARRRAERPAAIRLRSDTDGFTVRDVLHGSYEGVVDDLSLVRNDGVAAYNLAVVVDDADQGIDQVVRGDDLLSSAPRQAYLASLLGLPAPTYAHVPLAVNAQGERLAKRDGSITLTDLARLGVKPRDALARMARSLGMQGRTPVELLDEFDAARLPTEPWVVTAAASANAAQ
ncbi:tRNA glutamyl-Q(34) synthetase GluQRS [Solicola gregarius]|uniref:Glutamyl-Q tRNA(Asp) synthetase n=1 Tax=Solicola gregarius TaxID=2908642 RepID=A0AA46TM96_9ACTN|nr:tRNA glutamyl-Q(34) synthetase GluQRS [Solicola gregarius]UYM07013.1 tRNA glutamyl-Q(34) synthetase GluQRS [Solicola gregarius]